jgi:ATP-dependent Clp protease ATP-binding subunit ClpA
MEYVELESTVKEAIREHFTRTIGRPELLNRLGDNIVIFDFISKEVAGEIFDLQLRNVVRQVGAELGVGLQLDEAARSALRERCTRDEVLDNGGRGIGSEIESSLVNPLARYLFDHDCGPGTTVRVGSVSWTAAGSPVLDCVRS